MLIDMPMRALIAPCGDELVDLLIPAEEREEMKAYASRLP